MVTKKPDPFRFTSLSSLICMFQDGCQSTSHQIPAVDDDGLEKGLTYSFIIPV